MVFLNYTISQLPNFDGRGPHRRQAALNRPVNPAFRKFRGHADRIFDRVGVRRTMRNDARAFHTQQRRTAESGGAPLLGVKGACIITHGSSNANAIKNAVRVAAEFSERGINGSIERGLAAVRTASVEIG